MGKKTTKGEYNDFLDGEKLRDNADVRTTLSGSSVGTRDISPPQTRHDRRGRGKKDRGGPKKPQLTHFLYLPLVNEGTRPQFEEGLEKLKKELDEEEIIPVKAIRPLGTLHLTLGVMSLDENRLEEARQYLQELDLKALLRDITSISLAQRTAEDGAPAENIMPDTESLAIDIQSLIPMQAAHKTSVLYGQPKGDSQRLQAFGEALRARFTEKGLMVEDKRPLKLHATIVNTIYAKSGGRRGKGGKGKKGSKYSERSTGEDTVPTAHEEPATVSLGQLTAETETTPSGGKDKSSAPRDSDSWMRFDASSLVERYKDFVWARDVRIDTVQVCKMGAKKIWTGEKEGEGEVVGEEYQVVASKLI